MKQKKRQNKMRTVIKLNYHTASKELFATGRDGAISGIARFGWY